MTERDNTAPEYPVKVSRKEFYQETFLVEEANGAAVEIAPYSLFCDIFDAAGQRRYRLTEGDGLSRVNTNGIVVAIRTTRMNGLPAGKVKAELYGLQEGEREDFVNIILNCE